MWQTYFRREGALRREVQRLSATLFTEGRVLEQQTARVQAACQRLVQCLCTERALLRYLRAQPRRALAVQRLLQATQSMLRLAHTTMGRGRRATHGKGPSDAA